MIFLDTETTGLANSRLVELAYNSVILRCKPPIPIELGATVVNGITNEAVSDLPLFTDMPEYECIKNQLETDTVIAHNAPFDIGVLNRERIFPVDVIDTKELAKKKWPEAPSYALQNLRYWLKLDVIGEAHTASGDVAVLKALYKRLTQ